MAADQIIQRQWFRGIDSLRFILALVVLLSHFNNPYIERLTKSSDKYARFAGYIWANAFDGTAAVIAFFIISGFVIHYSNRNGIKSLKQFYIRRFLRILVPLFIISIAGSKFGHPEKAVLWSLICELIYYAIYPFLTKLPLNWLKQVYIAYVLAFLFIICGAKNDVLAAFNQSDLHYHGYYWQLGPFYTWIIGLPVWLLGILLAENIDKARYTSPSKLALLRLAVFSISCFIMLAKSYLHISYILSLNFFALLIYHWLKNEMIYYYEHKPLSILEHLGKFSYSLYICHPVVYLFLNWILPDALHIYIILIVATIGIAYLFGLMVERPAHLLAIRLSRTKAVAPISASDSKVF